LYGERNDHSISPVNIMEAWGFDYRTTLVWWKTPGLGMGSYFRTDTEFVLFGVRGGDCQIAPRLRKSNLFRAARRGHSQKPEHFYDLVESVSPAPRLELFSRAHHRLGWDVWGNESANTAQLGESA
jgi:N6-adenosine-specific RNA methylase IME4